MGLPCDVQDSALQVTACLGMAACLAGSFEEECGLRVLLVSAGHVCTWVA